MTYRLKFIPAALKEWKKLAPPIQKQFKKKLSERIKNLHSFETQMKTDELLHIDLTLRKLVAFIKNIDDYS